jgi:apolipoprotein D and lipocalin family protein
VIVLHRTLLATVILLLAASGPEGARAADRAPRVRPVDKVDLARYVGRWYEIAKIPNRFQRKCARGTTADYALREDGRITVLNRCLDADGDVVEAEGVARIVDQRGNARLEVSFVSFGGWRPIWGKYWVIGLDDDYRWAVVGEPKRKYGWILARTPRLDAESLAAAHAALERNGYARDDFEMSIP